MTEELDVEVAFAAPESQVLLALKVPASATVADAIRASGIQDRFPDYPLAALQVGVWGRVVSSGRQLQAGDRVEIYRELEIDPMEARRVRASAPIPDPSESR